MEESQEIRPELNSLHEGIQKMNEALGQVIVGQNDLLELMMVGLLADGHLLLEGVPGVAKTLAAKLLARTIQTPFSRIQFTPDLMPADVLGTSIFNPREFNFEFKKGPIFSGIVLIDEVNRAPAKTQAALFEVMEEKQVTMDGFTYAMQEPFMVVATQNPIEQEGTYRLPEAQLDRFLFKISAGYPTLEEEMRILHQQQHQSSSDLLQAVQPVMNGVDLVSYRKMVRSIILEPALIEFIAQLVGTTRNNSSLFLGASPRASLAIMKASKAYAAIHGRDFVLPEDILAVAAPVLRHRIILTPEKEMEGWSADQLIQELVRTVKVPR